MEYTENYNLSKPEATDYYNVADFNANADAIDAALYNMEQELGAAAQEETLAALSEKVGETADTGGSGTEGTVMAKLNETLSNVKNNVYGRKRFISSGTFTVPDGITVIYVTACGGGGGGGAGRHGNRGGGGGGGADFCVRRKFTVTPNTDIAITIGAGGAGGTGSTYTDFDATAAKGTAGGSTIIGSLITLSGGRVGSTCTSPASATNFSGGGGYGNLYGSGTSNLDSDGGNGFISAEYGFNGYGGPGSSGGGGGGSLGNGGRGASSSATTSYAGSDGSYGGGGGGGGAYTSSATFVSGNGGKGGAGLVIIEYGNIPSMYVGTTA